MPSAEISSYKPTSRYSSERLLLSAAGSGFRGAVQLARASAYHAGGREFKFRRSRQIPQKLRLFLAGEWNSLSQPALPSFMSGITRPRKRVRKSDTVGSASDWRLGPAL
jgi:hypothetical protein